MSASEYSEIGARHADLVSTIIPVFNGESFLGQAIESVLCQNYGLHEVIVVDDGSSDESANFARGYTGVRVISIPHQGVAAARNAGVQAARGRFIAFLDADDIWEPTKLAAQVEFLNANLSIDGVMGWMTNFLEAGVSRPGWLRENLLSDDVPAYSLCTLLARRQVFDRVGPFDPALPSGEDGDWFFRAKDKGVKFEMMNRRVLRRRVHEGNLSHDARSVRAGLLEVVRASVSRKRNA